MSLPPGFLREPAPGYGRFDAYKSPGILACALPPAPEAISELDLALKLAVSTYRNYLEAKARGDGAAAVAERRAVWKSAERIVGGAIAMSAAGKPKDTPK
ncbi:MAG: hypothetical protein IMY86_13830 [Chloroflexi bacterium]|nr:hypothetical protein [Chloroflexota bacterium]